MTEPLPEETRPGCAYGLLILILLIGLRQVIVFFQ